MKNSLRVINDTHIGTVRTAGTTPMSQWELRLHLLKSFEALLPTERCDVLINGDLFDQHTVALHDVAKVVEILFAWLNKDLGDLYLAPGNHDLSKTSNVLSSCEFVGQFVSSHPNGYFLNEAQMTPHGYVIPHVGNQALFDLELSRVPECDRLFLHCNYDNGFAAQSDQSLNLSAEQAAALPVKQIILGHEHHPRTVGKVLIPGNQIASSVSDWLQDSDKMCLNVASDGSVTFLVTARKNDQFQELAWTDLVVTDTPFIRVTGECQSADVTRMMSSINKLRNRSGALVITNAVRIVSEDSDTAAFAQALDSVQKFSIWKALEKRFTADEMLKLSALAEKDGLL